VTAGPTCPVERVDHPCPPRGLATDVSMLDAAGVEVRRTRSDADGNFALAIDPGRYTVRAQTTGPGRGCDAVDVTVVAGEVASVAVMCDTGIR